MSRNDDESARFAIADDEDLTIAAAVLQDATVRVDDLAYRRAERRFAFVANRYRWEGAHRGRGERIRTGLHFDDVLSAKRLNVPLEAADKPASVLELLTISWTAHEDGTGIILLVFAGNASVKLEVECLNGHLADLSEPWRAGRRPQHQAD